jgi:hypothetical protein
MNFINKFIFFITRLDLVVRSLGTMNDVLNSIIVHVLSNIIVYVKIYLTLNQVIQVVNELHYDEYFREPDFNSLEEQSFVKFYLRRNRTTNYNGSFRLKNCWIINKKINFFHFYLFIRTYNNIKYEILLDYRVYKSFPLQSKRILLYLYKKFLKDSPLQS